MLVATKDPASSAVSINPSNSAINPEGVEEDDDWVIVKQQTVTILIPPEPSLSPQAENQEVNCMPMKPRRGSKSSSGTVKRRHGELGKAAVAPVSNVQIDGVGLKNLGTPPRHAAIGNGNQINSLNHLNQSHVLPQQQLANAISDKNVTSHRKRSFGSLEPVRDTKRLPIGALNVVNMRLRALNLERKLQGVGGLTNWLVPQGLGRFVSILEKENLGKYQLANLTMSKLKDMGTDAVGPRRKLIQAIDSLCQPYYSHAPL